MKDTLSILKGTTPRCFSSFSNSKSVSSPEKWNSTEEFCTYSLGCCCGEGNLLLYGSKNESDPDEFWAPYYVRCPSCKHEDLVFSPKEHGWDGETGQCCSITGSIKTLYDPSPGTIVVNYSFQGLSNYEELVEEGVKNPYDYFDTFTIYFRSQAAKNFVGINGYECA